MNKQQFETITKWQNKVFIKATPLSCVNHLEEEVGELKKDIENGKYSLDEIADCFLLLFSICNKCGLEYEDVVNAIDVKMEVNYQRKWGEVNEKGYVKHIEPEESIGGFTVGFVELDYANGIEKFIPASKECNEPPTMGMSY